MVPAILVMTTMVLTTHGQTEKTLTNNDILELIETELSSDLIITMIETYPSEFETDLAKILALKKAGVPEAVLQAMLKATAAKRYDPTSDNQVLIYVSDSDSWSVSGGFAGGGNSNGGSSGRNNTWGSESSDCGDYQDFS